MHSNQRLHVIGVPSSLSPTIRCLAQPRVALASGAPVAQTLRFPIGLPFATAIAEAAAHARSTGGVVSLAARGPLPILSGLAATAIARAGIHSAQLELTVDGPALGYAGIEALLALSALRDQGVGIALRSFGVRQANLLARLPVSTVILARGGLRGIPGDQAATAAMHRLLSLARTQSLRIVATGIEGEAQRAILSGMGADDGEGSLFGTPVVQHSMA